MGIRPEVRLTQLVFLCLGFLQAQDIGLLRVHPFEKALSGRRSNAIGIQGHNPHNDFNPLIYIDK
jgi:hypothetical protein